MEKKAAIFRCPIDEYNEMLALGKANKVDLTRVVLWALVMLTDQCEAEGVIPSESKKRRKGGACAVGKGAQEAGEGQPAGLVEGGDCD